jgi:hypothetical protein
MSNVKHRSRPGYVETILRLTTDYGTTRVQQAQAPTADERAKLDRLAVEILGDIATIAQTRGVPSPSLDAQLAAVGLAVKS